MGLLSRSSLLLVVLVLLVPTTISQQCNSDICVLSCENCESIAVPDPNNCRGFYLCDSFGELVDVPLDCDPGQVFDASQHMCVEGEDCQPCTSPPASVCVFDCASLAETPTATTPGYIATLTDCQHYYKCAPDESDPTVIVATPMICPADKPFFGGEECEADETNCCHCRPYCSSEDNSLGQQIADPLDCRRYYLCTELDAVPTYSGSCSGELYFDSFMEECNDLVQCVTKCTNVIGTDGCIEPFTCEEKGYFARCPGQCTADYYHCTEATGEYQDVDSCNDGTVYNPNTHTCINEDDCPYSLQNYPEDASMKAKR